MMICLNATHRTIYSLFLFEIYGFTVITVVVVNGHNFFFSSMTCIVWPQKKRQQQSSYNGLVQK